MDEIMNFDAPGEISVGDNNLFELTGNLLADARAELTKATTLSVPIAHHIRGRGGLTGPCSQHGNTDD